MNGWPRGWRKRPLVGAVGISVLLLLVPAALVEAGTGLNSSRPLVVQTAVATSVVMTVGAGGFVFTPDFISNVAPGSTVTIQIQNVGSVPHTFTLSSLVNYTLPYSANTNLSSQFLVQHPAFISVNISEVQSSVTPVSFTAPTKIGSYQFFCQTPGHFASGMEGVLGVGVVVGPRGGPPGIGLPVFIISGTIVGLVIAAIVLGFVVGKREGTKHEMPPERLGYSETPSLTPPAKPPYTSG